MYIYTVIVKQSQKEKDVSHSGLRGNEVLVALVPKVQNSNSRDRALLTL